MDRVQLMYNTHYKYAYYVPIQYVIIIKKTGSKFHGLNKLFFFSVIYNTYMKLIFVFVLCEWDKRAITDFCVFHAALHIMGVNVACSLVSSIYFEPEMLRYIQIVII